MNDFIIGNSKCSPFFHCRLSNTATINNLNCIHRPRLTIRLERMKLLVANSCTNFVLSYPGGKDDVDNRTNETVIKTTGNTPADSFAQSKDECCKKNH